MFYFSLTWLSGSIYIHVQLLTIKDHQFKFFFKCILYILVFIFIFIECDRFGLFVKKLFFLHIRDINRRNRSILIDIAAVFENNNYTSSFLISYSRINVNIFKAFRAEKIKSRIFSS